MKTGRQSTTMKRDNHGNPTPNLDKLLTYVKLENRSGVPSCRDGLLVVAKRHRPLAIPALVCCAPKYLVPPLLQIPLALLPQENPLPHTEAVYVPPDPVVSITFVEPDIPFDRPAVAIPHEPLSQIASEPQWTLSLTS